MIAVKNEVYDKEVAKKMLAQAKEQLEVARINERYYQRVLIKGVNKMASQLLSAEQGKVKGTREFIEYLEEIINE